MTRCVGRALRIRVFAACAIVSTTLVLPRAAAASAPQPRACSGSAARAFDFWIGDWDISQRILRQDGTWLELPATTSVTATLDGCALVEHWRGRVMFFWEGMQTPEPMAGLSVRAYDPQTGKWSINWMDTRSPRFGGPYVGAFANGRGEFFRDTETPTGRRIDRITFSDVAPNSVTWALAVSSDDGRAWRTIWTMNMSRRSAAAAEQAASGAWIETVGAPQYFAVLVEDVDRSVAWYQKVFGLRDIGDSTADDGSSRIVNLSNDHLFVEIIRDDRAQSVERARGFRKVGFQVPDVEAVAERAARATGERPRVLDFQRFGVRIIQLRDPDGNIVQLSSPR